MVVIKKDGSKEPYNSSKILSAVNKSAERALVALSDDDCITLLNEIKPYLNEEMTVEYLHNVVEKCLDKTFPEVAKTYRDYRNYKKDFVHMLDGVYKKAQSIMYIGDRDNANTDSALIPTRRSLIYNELNKELYKKFFLTVEELQAIKDGYIYIHDMSARRDTWNCCLADVNSILEGGFEMGNLWYNEPKTLDVAFDVIADVIMSMASCQYGGWSGSQIDKLLSKYCEMSYHKYFNEFIDIVETVSDDIPNHLDADEYAMKKVRRDLEQGFQAWEYKFNTVGSSRGDYPFIAISFGLDKTIFGKMVTEVCLEVRKNGQGKKGFKKPVLFPKLTFLYDENLHGEGCELEYLFDKAIECSSKSMYPDFLSLTGEGYVADMYKKYGEVISPMGELK